MSDLSLGTRLKNAWNIFRNKDSPINEYSKEYGESYSDRPDRKRVFVTSERTIINSIFNRISVDVSTCDIYHVRLDDKGRYFETLKTGLNNCLTLEANIDQSGKDFIRDVVLSLLDEGCIGLLPVDVLRTKNNTIYDVLTIRTCKIIQWYPNHVRVKAYDDRTGKKKEIIVEKKDIAIVENPFYSIMNNQNSILKRLTTKLNYLDAIDKITSSGKLDVLIQLPYAIKTESQKKLADERMKGVERQLSSNNYGIAYIDGTERVIQLNRAVENKLMEEVTYLTSMLFSQLGMTESILNGTASESEMLNYYNRIIEPILTAIIDSIKRKFLSITARTQGQSILFFRDPFKLVPVNQIADIADKFTRNEILSSNEIRAIIGYKPSDDPEADELRNKNLNRSDNEKQPTEIFEKEEKNQNES